MTIVKIGMVRAVRINVRDFIWFGASFYHITLYPPSPSAPTGIVVVPCIRPPVRPTVCRPERRRYHSYSLRISPIGLKYGRVMHSDMKEIAIQDGYGRPIFT